MTYQETLSYIYGLGRFGMKPGLERITATLQALHNPQDAFKTVHVAGTNGKGSTSSFLASMLAEGGHRVGLFTSPHLINFTERIRINGREIAEEEVVHLAEQVIAAAPPETTFFELVTAMATLYFAEQKVQLAIMEVGMGGRLDATNALSGILSLITPVAYDHCDYLGASLAAIAGEKAGVIKVGRSVVVSPQEQDALSVIRNRCLEMKSPFYGYGEAFTAFWSDTGLSYRGIGLEMDGLRPGLAGRYQQANAASALAAAELLDGMGFPLDAGTLRSGIEKAHWPGRMEILGTSPRILLDGAHNPAGSKALAEALEDIPRDRLLIVAGMMGDKDVDGILGPLLPLADEMLAVAPSLARALPSEKLAEFCRSRGVTAHDAGTVAAGLSSARDIAGPDDLILVCGSLFTVGEARAVLLSKNFEPFRG
ncbi:bifunctional folylpolyglutamate synthase/dihydrofolate synthase [Geotalea uraniireducens]|uniref:Dihydrofolate synthase/folylpolyglutamate synthase n=1 Tax=Geotalea uraniireducens (strain Rf4) TaxID=351605 RepID=A5G6L8_GEOUR|nr:folylpolyglutamate synthase/dihydrofolate synthase family protein [Geotalea uraniireducens]ABQ27436.1 FolC bifunctional protein [Geotalea uraniireducens Rf4]